MRATSIIKWLISNYPSDFYDSHKKSTIHPTRPDQQMENLSEFPGLKEFGMNLQLIFKIASTSFCQYLFTVERGFIEGSLRVHWGLRGLNLIEPPMNPLSTPFEISLCSERNSMHLLILQGRSLSKGQKNICVSISFS